MIKIGVGDWIVARSDNFKFLMSRLRDHQITTKSSFSKVKQKHKTIDAKIASQETRIKRLERVLKSLREVPAIRITRRKKNARGRR